VGKQVAWGDGCTSHVAGRCHTQETSSGRVDGPVRGGRVALGGSVRAGVWQWDEQRLATVYRRASGAESARGRGGGGGLNGTLGSTRVFGTMPGTARAAQYSADDPSLAAYR